MAILKVSSARNVNAGNKTLTFGKGTNGGLTVTGTIYDASGITKKYAQVTDLLLLTYLMIIT